MTAPASKSSAMKKPGSAQPGTPDPLQDHTEGHAPGRPREFDEATALAAALDVFWRQGYEATSLDDLTSAMGISRSSFYACFGSKQGALLRAIVHYSDHNYARLAAIADGEPNARKAVRTMLAQIANARGGPEGCFFVNCITELAPHDAKVIAHGRQHLDRLEDLFARNLLRAVPGKAKATTKARALLSLALGATMLRKAGVPADRIEAMLAEADALLP
jgi:TetR/AcrR family transcriptional regulator, transcriptional repressor for nem operon